MVSFGDFVAADILSPAITVLDHNPRILARIAMKRLVVLMSGEKQESQGDTIVPLSIIARGSGELSASVLEVSA
jgi:LacI family transcriptional regulator